jgi:hypothetical protein
MSAKAALENIKIMKFFQKCRRADIFAPKTQTGARASVPVPQSKFKRGVP